MNDETASETGAEGSDNSETGSLWTDEAIGQSFPETSATYRDEV